MAKTLEEMIAELKGLAPIKGGVMSLLDTPANNEQETKRTQYLMDMFSGTNPETGDSFLEPTPKNEYRNDFSEKMNTIKFLADQMGISVQEFLATGSGARGLNTPAERDKFIEQTTSNNLGFSSENRFQTPLQDNAQAVLSRLSETELRDVMEILPQLTPAQYMAFIAGLENGSINPSGYEVQNFNRMRM